MLIFYVETLLCFLFTYILYNRYAHKQIDLHVSILVIVVWLLTFFNVVLLPIDIYVSFKYKDNPDENERDYSHIYYIWVTIYWLIFLLSWVIIPLIQEYEKAADFTVEDRIKRSIKVNLYFYSIVIGISVLFLIYLIFRQKLTFGNLIAFMIALSNAWGIFLIIALLGYGLVEVPKTFWKEANVENRMKYLQWEIRNLRESLDDRKEELTKCLLEIQKLRSKFSDIEISQELASELDLKLNSATGETDYYFDLLNDRHLIEKELKQYINYYDYEKLIDLKQRIHLFSNEKTRLQVDIEEVFKEWNFLKNLSPSLEVDLDCYSKTKQYYYFKLKPKLLLCFGIVFAVCSVCVTFAEITIFINYPLNAFGLIINHSISNSLLLLNISCILALAYLCLCSLVGLFNFKISGVYSIQSNQHTDSNSLLFLSGFMCRIGFPLCLNFLNMLKLKTETALETLLGVIYVVPIFGQSFTIFYPIILIFFCVFHYYEVYSKIVSWFGFSIFDPKSKYTNEKIDEGLELMNKMRISYQSGIPNYSTFEKEGYLLISKTATKKEKRSCGDANECDGYNTA